MVAFRMEDLKDVTTKLFVADTFDTWLVREAVVVTFNSFTIDGHIRQGYYSEEELEQNQIEELSSWKMIRPICFSLIKGKKLPESFQITLQLAPREVAVFLERAQVGFSVEQVQGLCIHIRYENQTLHCVTGTSLKIFTLDKQIEFEWDEAVRLYLKAQQIAFVEE